jgi:ATP-binding cassette subfamily F protein 3
MEGAKVASGKMKVGYFTQYQVEELDGDDTPLAHMTRVMPGKTPAAVRAQLGRFGFSGDKATTQVRKLSGGERARLALALITREAPHLLILDEPTNHLDVDAREALVQALNSYSGAVVVVSHDRHMVELTADRLVLVDGGTAREYDGSLEDYMAFVLSSAGAAKRPEQGTRKKDRRAAADLRAQSLDLRRAAEAAEAEVTRLTAERSAIDRAMFDPAGAALALAKLPMSTLARMHAETSTALDQAELAWLEISERLEQINA